MSAISVTECNRYRHLLVRYGDTNTIIWNTYTKTRITAHQTKLGVKCERSSIMCKIFQDFQRWQNDIVDNTERHNSVDNGLYRGVRPMEDNALHTGHEPNDTATSQEKPLNTHKPCYTSIQVKDHEIHSHRCLIESWMPHTRIGRGRKEIPFQTILTGQNGANAPTGAFAEKYSHVHPSGAIDHLIVCITNLVLLSECQLAFTAEFTMVEDMCNSLCHSVHSTVFRKIQASGVLHEAYPGSLS